MARVLVVGGGPAGCAATHLLTDAGYEVTVIERSGVLGGDSRTYYEGGHPYTLGPRHFLTKQERVWNFLDKHCPMKLYHGHEFLSYVERDRKFYHFPIHRDEVPDMPDHAEIERELGSAGPDLAKLARNLEEYWIFSVGHTLYDKFVKSYSQKMWPDAKNTDIDYFGFTPKGVALKTGPIKAAWSEVMSGFPKARNGFDDYWDVAVSAAKVYFNTRISEYDFEKRRVSINGEWLGPFDHFVLTISPEDVFKFCLADQYGKLRWMGRDFHKWITPASHLPNRCVFPPDVFFQYYVGNEPFTRVVEYKKFYEWDLPSETTLLGFEIPSKNNELYPYPISRDVDLAKRYQDFAPDYVHWFGRKGAFRYKDFGEMIGDGFDLVEQLA